MSKFWQKVFEKMVIIGRFFQPDDDTDVHTKFPVY